MENHIAYNKDYINFRKVRDFGELLGAPLVFLRQEFKMFSKAMLLYAGPFLIISLIVIGFLIKHLLAGTSFENNSELFGATMLYIAAALVFFVLAFSMANSVLHSYVSLYVERGKDGFTLEDVWMEAKSNFFPLWGKQIVVGIITMFGFLFLYIPGIYLQIALSFVFIASVQEKLNFGKSISRSFQLIRGEWWIAFALNMILGIVISIVSYILIIPAFIIMAVGAATGSGNIGMIVMYAVLAILYFALYLFMYSVQILLSDFHYFSIVEAKESPGLMQKVRAMRTEEKPVYHPDTATEKFDIDTYAKKKDIENERIKDSLKEPENTETKKNNRFDNFDYEEDNRFSK